MLSPSTTASNTLQNLVNSLFPHSAATTAPPLDAGQILADPNYNLANQAMTQLVTNSNLQSNNICALWRGVSGITGLQRLSMDMTKDAAVRREMALICVKAQEYHRTEIQRIVDNFRARIVDTGVSHYIIEVTGRMEKVEAMLQLLTPMGIKKVARSGILALYREPG